MQKINKVIPQNLLMREEKLLTKFINSKRNPFNNLRNLYDFMDDLSSHVHKITPCHKGCGNCCHINVSISELEANFIAEKTNNSIVKTVHTTKRDFHGEQCPFLEDNVCSIYPVRPFVCRRHLFLGSSELWCHPDTANDYEFPQLRFSEIDKSYALILKQAQLTNRKDIREFFSQT